MKYYLLGGRLSRNHNILYMFVDWHTTYCVDGLAFCKRIN